MRFLCLSGHVLEAGHRLLGGDGADDKQRCDHEHDTDGEADVNVLDEVRHRQACAEGHHGIHGGSGCV